MNTTTAPIDLIKYNGYVTVKNPATGNHRTFRISTGKKGYLEGKRFISLLVGPDNTSNYKGFAWLQDDGKIRVWVKCQSKTFIQYAYILGNPEKFKEEKGLEYSMSVRCRRCNRDLTEPESIRLGIGPVCRGIP